VTSARARAIRGYGIIKGIDLLPRMSRRGCEIDVSYARDDIYGEDRSYLLYPRRRSRRRDASAESDPEVLSRVP